MRDWTSVVAGAIGGALLGVVIVFAAAHQGWLPGTGGRVVLERGSGFANRLNGFAEAGKNRDTVVPSPSALLTLAPPPDARANP